MSLLPPSPMWDGGNPDKSKLEKAESPTHGCIASHCKGLQPKTTVLVLSGLERRLGRKRLAGYF